MADSKKTEKIAAGLKLLKQYQKKNKDGSPSNGHDEKSSKDTAQPFLNGKNNEVTSVFIDSGQESSQVKGEGYTERHLEQSQVIFQPNSLDIGQSQPYQTSFNATNPFANNTAPASNVSSFFTSQQSIQNNVNFFDNIIDERNNLNTQVQPSNIEVSKTPPSVTSSFYNIEQKSPKSVVLSNVPNSEKTQEPLHSSSHETNLLEIRNTELEDNLSKEKKQNIELQQQLKKSQDQIYELQCELKSVQGVYVANIKKEILSLEEKLQLQSRTIEILVSEKTELLKQVEGLQEENKAKSAQCDDLSGRLRTYRSHAAQLEKDISDSQEARQQHNNILKRLELSQQEKTVEINNYKQNLDERELEIKELKRRLDASFNECSLLQKQVAEKDSKLSLVEIKMQQLGNGQGVNLSFESPSEEVLKEVENLKQEVVRITNEKDQTVHQFQQYINSLNSQLQEFTAKFETVSAERDDLKVREQSLVNHISELEKQMQKQSVGITTSVELTEQNSRYKQQAEEDKKKIDQLETMVSEKSCELENLRSQLDKSEEEMSRLERRLEEMATNVPDAKLLQAAMESDKVAASRALQQNNTLKQQLEEMHQQFIRLSNNKLEIMEQLEHEQHLTIQLREELGRIKQVQNKLDVTTQLGQGILVDGCSQTTYHDVGETLPTDPVSPEAMMLLEEKFRKTMENLAELSEEKQKLEHLVLQLQGETETIGEYIALYQAQRTLLQRRATEKDHQVELIAKEKEELREKLNQLSSLVPQLVSNNAVSETSDSTTTAENKESSGGETANKILSLITEIGTSSLVQDKHLHETLNFHPCPLCSGRLITV